MAGVITKPCGRRRHTDKSYSIPQELILFENKLSSARTYSWACAGNVLATLFRADLSA